MAPKRGADGHLPATPPVIGVPHRPLAAVAKGLALGHQSYLLEEGVAFRATIDARAAVVTAAWEPWGARHERRGPETARWGAPADAQRRSERLASRQRRGPGARDARGDNRPSHLSGAASRPHAVVTARPEPQGRRGDVRRRHRERHGRCTQPMAPTPGSVVRRGCQCSVDTTCRTLMLRPTRSQLLPGSGSVP